MYCKCPKACQREEYKGGLSFSQISTNSVTSYWTQNNSSLKRKRHHALNFRHRLDPRSIATTIRQIQSLIVSLEQFQRIVVGRFFPKDSGIFGMTLTAVQEINSLQREDIIGKMFQSWDELVRLFTAHVEPHTISAIHAVNSTISGVKDMEVILITSENGCVAPRYFDRLKRFQSSIRLANDAVDNAFIRFQSGNELVPDYMVENRFSKWQKCIKCRDTVYSISEQIVSRIENATSSMFMFNLSMMCFPNETRVSWDTSEGFQKQSEEFSVRIMILRYRHALADLKSCLAKYGDTLAKIGTWLSGVDSELGGTEPEFSIFEEPAYRRQMRSFINTMSRVKTLLAVNKISVFDVWKGFCENNLEVMLEGLEIIASKVGEQLMKPLESKLETLRVTFIQHYLGGLRRLAPIPYFFESSFVKKKIELDARSLDLWRRPTFNHETKKVSLFSMFSASVQHPYPPTIPKLHSLYYFICC